ncbi:Gamma-glutamylputrescine oxidoreductase [Beauveria bassiana]|uniref:Gamma-glutamylputrescine oxidoreductase n=1 Tax=Beauveria bassiana TaxID=176275 RepID=A0A2N6NU86_BEABA|nr:Gamma-glutamylputrescine oxidoreductase [Beauveria bassiana]
MAANGNICLPVPGEPQSYWQHEGRKDNRNSNAVLEPNPLPSQCHVVIVGGGYAGIATAYHLLSSEGPPLQVVLIEARQPCSGATGRNGGHLRPDYFLSAAANASKYDAAKAAEVVQFEVSHLAAIRDLIQAERIDCDYSESTSLQVFTTSEQATMARKKYESLMQEPELREILLRHVTLYTDEDAAHKSGVRGAKGHVATPAAQLSSYKLFTALLNRCLDLGLRLKTDTAVVSVEESSCGKQVVKTATAGAVEASKVVIATNAYTASILPDYASSIIPCKGLVCHIASRDDRVLPRLPTSSLALMQTNAGSNARGYSYLLQRADSTIVVGGAHHMYDDEDPGSWYNTVDDRGSIAPVQRYFEDDFMQRMFVGWEDSQAYVKRSWSGIMGYSTDALPHVGEVPDRKGLFVLAGFHGHGMPVLYLTAKGIADMIRHGQVFEDTELPSLYKTTRSRLESTTNVILAGRGMQAACK